MTISLDLPEEYGYVLLCAAVMAFSIIIIGFLFPGRARGRIFTQEYLKKNFGAEHLTATGKEIAKGGYPDTGNGYYSKNQAMLNEWIASCLAFLLIGGLYFPIPAASVGLGVVVARFIYAWGYSSGGPAGRLVGALSNDLLVLAQFVLAVISSIYFIKGNELPK